jgi:multimeric flavodoxin WrbA
MDAVKFLGICGSPVKNGNVETLLRASLAHVEDREGVETEVIALADMQFEGCTHCNWCPKKQSEGKFCAQEDDMSAIYPKILAADGLLLATPVHFGRLSGSMANMIDRLRAFVHGNIYHGRLKNKVGGGLAVAFLRGGGVETALTTLNSMFLVFEMIIATSRLYQLGAAAFTSVDGTGKVNKGVRHMALEDPFGVASANLLAERMVELARIMKAGQRALEQ